MGKTIIAVDIMGGDFGPKVTLAGLAKTQTERPEVNFLLFGDGKEIKQELDQKHPKLIEVSEIMHCEMSIPMDTKPSIAVRQGRKVSGMWQAIHAVKQGHARACVSAGNTGALMAMSKIILRTPPGIERPALAAIWPTVRGKSVVLDVGATIGGSKLQYAQFAVMGAVYARTVFGLKDPSIGILNIGVEDIKGTDAIREAAEILTQSELNFIGFVEGDGIGQGHADVIVTDGFTGNVALKTAEGTARQIGTYLSQAMSSTLFSRLGYWFARGAFNVLRLRMDPNAANGGMFLGLGGVVVKSHGGVDAAGFSTAVEMAIETAEADIIETISHDIEKMQNVLDDIWAGSLD